MHFINRTCVYLQFQNVNMAAVRSGSGQSLNNTPALRSSLQSHFATHLAGSDFVCYFYSISGPFLTHPAVRKTSNLRSAQTINHPAWASFFGSRYYFKLIWLDKAWSSSAVSRTTHWALRKRSWCNALKPGGILSCRGDSTPAGPLPAARCTFTRCKRRSRLAGSAKHGLNGNPSLYGHVPSICYHPWCFCDQKVTDHTAPAGGW